MHKPALLATALGASILFSGCVGTGPHTEQGAVTGGALGALAGGIIGNNSRGGDTVGGMILGAAAGALAGGAIGNSVDQERGTIYGGPTPDDRAYRSYRTASIPTPPPAPAESIPPQPAANAVWVPGYWIYDGRGFSWASGRWEIPPPGARSYIAPHNEVQNGQTIYVPGYWQ